MELLIGETWHKLEQIGYPTSRLGGPPGQRAFHDAFLAGSIRPDDAPKTNDRSATVTEFLAVTQARLATTDWAEQGRRFVPKLAKYLAEFQFLAVPETERANGNGGDGSAPADDTPPPGLRFKPQKIDGTWYITATGTGIEHSRASWPKRWGPWRLTPENWQASWGPYPDDVEDDPRLDPPPREPCRPLLSEALGSEGVTPHA